MADIVKLRFKYDDNATRLYSFDCDESLVLGVKEKVQDINSSLYGGIAGGLSSFFVSDAGSNLARIDGATIESSESVPIQIAPNS